MYFLVFIVLVKNYNGCIHITLGMQIYLNKPRASSYVEIVALSFFESFLNWNSLHARLNGRYKAWSYKKKKHKNIKIYRESLQKEPTVNNSRLTAI